MKRIMKGNNVCSAAIYAVVFFSAFSILCVSGGSAADVVADVGNDALSCVVSDSSSCSGGGHTTSQSSLIDNIKVRGNVRVPTETIMSKILFDVGARYDDDIANESIKSICATGYFESASMQMDGSTLFVDVDECEYIKDIVIDDGRILPVGSQADELKKLMKSSMGNMLSRNSVIYVNSDLLRSNEFQGDLFGVSKAYKFVKDDKLHLAISKLDGEKIKIKRVSFIGNQSFVNDDLLDHIYSSSSKFATKSAGINYCFYNPMVIKQDIMLLQNFYKERGYIDVVVRDAYTVVDVDTKTAELYFIIDEGKRYEIGVCNIVTNVKELADDMKVISKNIQPGSVYDVRDIKDLQRNIIDAAHAQKCSNISVTIKNVKKEGSNIVDLDVRVDRDKDAKYISKIVVKGNSKTKTSVIMSVAGVQEGEYYSAELRDDVEGRLNRSGLFESASLHVEDDPKSANTSGKVLIIEVVEQEKTVFSFAISYQAGKFALRAPINIVNLLGTGYDVSLDADLLVYDRDSEDDYKQAGSDNAKSTKLFSWDGLSVNASVMKRNIFDTDIATKCGIGVNTSQYPRYLLRARSYDLDFDVTFDINNYIDSRLSIGIGYRDFYHRGYDGQQKNGGVYADVVRNIVSQNIENSSKKCNVNIGCGLTLSVPVCRGVYFYAIPDVNFSVLNDRYIKCSVSAGTIFRLPLRSRVRCAFSCGGIFESDDHNMCIVDAYTFGGLSFRGFRYGGIGPSIGIGNKARSKKGGSLYVGATRYQKLSIDGELPVDFGIQFLEKMLKPKLLVFGDIGRVYGIPNGVSKNGHIIDDDRKIKVSVGCGLAITLPVFNLQLKFMYALPVVKSDYNQEDRFIFDARNS